MDRKQRNFALIIAALVALFALVLVILNNAQKPTIPAPVPPVATTTPFPVPTTGTPNSTPSPAATPTSHATPTASQPSVFYAAPDGSEENDGSKEHPWSLQYVLDNPPIIHPGDTVWLQGGTYTGPFTSSLLGAEGSPITVRAMPGERAILKSDDLVLDIANSAYVNFWGLEITATTNTRDPNNPKESAYGVRINQGKPSNHIKFINMIVHDMPAQGFGWWQANTDSEIYGCLVFYNGITQFDHGIYLHNSDGKKSIIDNVIFDNASHGIHAYGEKDYQKLNNIFIEGNTVFDNGSIGFNTKVGNWGGFKRNILVGGLLIAENPVIIDNYTYYPGGAGEAFNLGYRAGSKDAVVENNYFGGGQVELAGVNSELTMLKNTILGFSLGALPRITLGQGQNNLLLLKPDDTKTFVRPNQYDSARANITIYNWSKKQQVALSADDLKGIQIKSGDRYELHNVQDYFNDVVSGVYGGDTIDIPMTSHSVAQPLGLNFKPKSTFPEFGTFVLIVQPAN